MLKTKFLGFVHSSYFHIYLYLCSKLFNECYLLRQNTMQVSYFLTQKGHTFLVLKSHFTHMSLLPNTGILLFIITLKYYLKWPSCSHTTCYDISTHMYKNHAKLTGHFQLCTPVLWLPFGLDCQIVIIGANSMSTGSPNLECREGSFIQCKQWYSKGAKAALLWDSSIIMKCCRGIHSAMVFSNLAIC